MGNAHQWCRVCPIKSQIWSGKAKIKAGTHRFTVKMLPLPIETDNKQKNTKMKDIILAISGKPGLYRLVSQGHNMLIVETIDANKKRIPAGVRDRVTSLNDVSMYTDEDDKPLMEIFENIKNKENGQAVALDYKKASAAELADFMAAVLPNYDRDRVYNTDIKNSSNGITSSLTTDTPPSLKRKKTHLKPKMQLKLQSDFIIC